MADKNNLPRDHRWSTRYDTKSNTIIIVCSPSMSMSRTKCKKFFETNYFPYIYIICPCIVQNVFGNGLLALAVVQVIIVYLYYNQH